MTEGLTLVRHSFRPLPLSRKEMKSSVRKCLSLPDTFIFNLSEAELAEQKIYDDMNQKLLSRVKELEDAIKEVVTQVADDLCWLDVYTNLSSLVGLPFEVAMIPTNQFIANCKRYENSIRTGCKYDSDESSEVIKQLQAENQELRAALEILSVLPKSMDTVDDVQGMM